MTVCHKCGSSEKYKSGKCRPCTKAVKDRWREKNAVKVRAMNRANYEATRSHQLAVQAARRAENPELYKQRVKRWVDANPQKMIDLRKRWKADNRERVCAYSQDRRAKAASSGGSLSDQQIKNLMVLQKGKCAACRISIANSFHADHIEPLSKGGKNHIHNIQLLCPKCNLQKGAKDPIKFMESRGFLL